MSININHSVDEKCEPFDVSKNWDGLPVLTVYKTRHVDVRELPYRYKTLRNQFRTPDSFYIDRYRINRNISKGICPSCKSSFFNLYYNNESNRYECWRCFKKHGKGFLTTNNIKHRLYTLLKNVDPKIKSWASPFPTGAKIKTEELSKKLKTFKELWEKLALEIKNTL